MELSSTELGYIAEFYVVPLHHRNYFVNVLELYCDFVKVLEL